MCTAFVKKGNDIITGFNFDMISGGMNYKPVVTKDKVYLGMCLAPEVLANIPPSVRISDGIRLVQGVSAGGYVGGQLGNMDSDKFPTSVTESTLTIDQLTDDFVSEQLYASQLIKIMEEKEVTNLPCDPTDEFAQKPLPLHSLLVDPEGNVIFVEPGNGYAVIKEKYFVVTNFPILEMAHNMCDDKFEYYGVDRYQKALKILKESTDDFSAADGIKLLNEVKQTGDWATRFSFVYSRNENKVYFCSDGDFEHMQELTF